MAKKTSERRWMIAAVMPPVIVATVLLWTANFGLLPISILIISIGVSLLLSRFVRHRVQMVDQGIPLSDGDGNETGEAHPGIIEYLTDAIIAVDKDRIVIEANRAARELLGASLVGRDIILSLRQPGVVEAIDQALATGEQVDHSINLLRNSERHFMLQVIPVERAESVGGAVILLRDVTEQKRSEQMRADFVANASHELKTPLASLIGFIETLQGSAADDTVARTRFLGIMAAESGRMARLIDDLLSLSRIELDEHRQPRSSADLGKILPGARDTLEGNAQKKGMDIVLEDIPSDSLVRGDVDQLTQVFQNLIDNAIKYGRDGSSITISVSHQDRLPGIGGPGIAVAIDNEGEGIGRDHIPRLTDRFYRVDPSRSRDLGSTGLGLAIVKHIVNRHRGVLKIESTVGQGTTVTIGLPVA